MDEKRPSRFWLFPKYPYILFKNFLKLSLPLSKIRRVLKSLVQVRLQLLHRPLFQNFSLFQSFSPEYPGCMCKLKKQPPKVFIEISQNSQENTCARVSFFNKVARPATLLKNRLWHRCFPVNFAKFLWTPFLRNTSGRLKHISWAMHQRCLNDVSNLADPLFIQNQITIYINRRIKIKLRYIPSLLSLSIIQI